MTECDDELTNYRLWSNYGQMVSHPILISEFRVQFYHPEIISF